MTSLHNARSVQCSNVGLFKSWTLWSPFVLSFRYFDKSKCFIQKTPSLAIEVGVYCEVYVSTYRHQTPQQIIKRSLAVLITGQEAYLIHPVLYPLYCVYTMSSKGEAVGLGFHVFRCCLFTCCRSLHNDDVSHSNCVSEQDIEHLDICLLFSRKDDPPLIRHLEWTENWAVRTLDYIETVSSI